MQHPTINNGSHPPHSHHIPPTYSFTNPYRNHLHPYSNQSNHTTDNTPLIHYPTFSATIESSQLFIYHHPSIFQNIIHVPSPPNLKYLTQQPTEFPHNILNPAIANKKKDRHHAQQPPPISSTPCQRKAFRRTICTSKKTETPNPTPQQTQGSLVCERSEKEHKDCDETQ